jgi:hypothetical protein
MLVWECALAAKSVREASGRNLFDNDFTVSAAGVGDQGGTRAVTEQFTILRGIAKTLLLADGKPKYRIIALVDKDFAGKGAVKSLREVDRSILEYKDVFLLHPEMPLGLNLDPSTLKSAFDRANATHASLDWEIEDLLPTSFLNAFGEEHPGAIIRRTTAGSRTHHDFSSDGKSRLHRYVRANAIPADCAGVADVLHALRFYMGLPHV